MKQRILICGLSLLLTFSLAGCGGQQAQQEPQDPDQRKVQQSEPASTTPPVESMEVNNENDTAKPLTELEDIEPEEADGAGILEGAGNAESDLEEVDPFTEVNETVYATGTVNLRSGPSTAHDKVGSLNKSDSVTRVGIGTAEAEGWSRIQLSDGSTVYVSNKYLSTTKPVVQQQQTSKPSGGSTTTQQQTGGTQQQNPSSYGDDLTDEEYLEIERRLNEQYIQNGGTLIGSEREGQISASEEEYIGTILNGGGAQYNP